MVNTAGGQNHDGIADMTEWIWKPAGERSGFGVSGKPEQARGEASNRNKAATAARAFARPIGGASEANCREIWKMVPPAGFEPATP